MVRDLAQLLATGFLHPLSIFCSFTAGQIKSMAGHQTKSTLAFELVLKGDRHDETKG